MERGLGSGEREKEVEVEFFFFVSRFGGFRCKSLPFHRNSRLPALLRPSPRRLRRRRYVSPRRSERKRRRSRPRSRYRPRSIRRFHCRRRRFLPHVGRESSRPGSTRRACCLRHRRLRGLLRGLLLRDGTLAGEASGGDRDSTWRREVERERERRRRPRKMVVVCHKAFENHKTIEKNHRQENSLYLSFSLFLFLVNLFLVSLFLVSLFRLLSPCSLSGMSLFPYVSLSLSLPQKRASRDEKGQRFVVVFFFSSLCF